MITLLSKDTKKDVQINNDDFNRYLKEQRVKTTFNGIEVAAFSWYKRILGLE